MASHSSSAPESGRCQACGRFFILEASLTKHIRNHCSAAQERSRRLWKNGASNIKKLNASLAGADSRKRVYDELQEGYHVHDKQPANIDHGIVLVRIVLVIYSALAHTTFLPGCRTCHHCVSNGRGTPF